MKEVRPEQLILAEVQVLLAELRTYLSTLRTGVTLLASSLSAAFLLAADDRLFTSYQFSHLILIIKLFLVLLAILGFWRFISSERKIMKIHKLLKNIEHENKRLDDILV